MPSSLLRAAAGLSVLIAVACAGEPAAKGDDSSSVASGTERAPAPERVSAPATVPAAAAPGGGTARVLLTIGTDTIRGDFPAALCGGPFVLGEGVAYQTQADGWRITVASEARQMGDVPLNTPAGEVSVVVTINGPGSQLVRGPRNGGSLRITDDFRRAEADLEVRGVGGGPGGRLLATFTCDATT